MKGISNMDDPFLISTTERFKKYKVTVDVYESSIKRYGCELSIESVINPDMAFPFRIRTWDYEENARDAFEGAVKAMDSILTETKELFDGYISENTEFFHEVI